MFFPSRKPSKCNQQLCFQVNVNSITGLKVSLQFLKWWSVASPSCSFEKWIAWKSVPDIFTRLMTLHRPYFQKKLDCICYRSSKCYTCWPILHLSSIYYCCVYICYRPQRSWGKVMFSQVCVLLFTGGMSASVHAGMPPHPPEQTPPRIRPPRADTPGSRPPPRSRHLHRADNPPGADTPPPQSMLGDMVNARAVCILLECNLVILCIYSVHFVINYRLPTELREGHVLVVCVITFGGGVPSWWSLMYHGK